jgi:hypothetical protein
MRKIAFWALPLLLAAAFTANGFAQATCGDPKWKDNKEYEDYKVVYDEKDLAKKATIAEKFFVDHKDADPCALTNMYHMLILAYANGSNWAKTLETVERFNLGPKLTDADKAKYTEFGLLAATNLNNNAKVIEYANKVLATSPTNLNALISKSRALSQDLPTQDPAKSTRLAEVLEVTNKALAQPKPQGVTDAQWNPIQQQLHETACLMLLNQNKYADSIGACQAALKVNGKDGYAWYLIGMSRKAELKPLLDKYKEALDKYNAERTADQITVDENRALYQGREKVASDKRDEAVDAFARAAAIGGSASAESMKELKNLFMGTPEELNKLIEEKKAQTGN